MSINTVALINLTGFATGAALYAMLLVMVLRHPARISRVEERGGGSIFGPSVNGLLLATGLLGLVWNVGTLATYGAKDFGLSEPLPLVVAGSFAALGFLPAVVVHSVLQGQERVSKPAVARWIKIAAYVLSAGASVMHFYSGLIAHAGPSNSALRALTVGYVLLILILFATTRRQPGWKRAVWGSALAVFAVSALHLSQHHYGGTENWSIELVGHHASLPLALAILYQDYRFAFADILLKRALALLVLVGLAFGLYLTVVSPLLTPGGERSLLSAPGVGVLLCLWVGTALLYPILQRAVVGFVDKAVLRRADYVTLRSNVGHFLTTRETESEILDEVCLMLTPALSAEEVRWVKTEGLLTEEDRLPHSLLFNLTRADADSSRQAPQATLATRVAVRIPENSHEECVLLLERSTGASAIAFIPTAEPPFHAIIIGALSGGRRILSGDVAMLESVSLMVARRIDSLRVTHERCEQVQREQEISKLATEAQLRALRAQINPHFLFNSLTTIGYLVQSAPDRALETLMRLTSLLRGVLRTSGEFVTLGEELNLIASYLDIERARFEERLRVSVDVPQTILDVRLPSLLLQPLVENAVKHGVARSRFGGEVHISASLEPPPEADGSGGGGMLHVVVSDTGAGASEIELARGRKQGVGLNNVEQRLKHYGGQAAALRIESTPGAGTTVQMRIPVASSENAQAGHAETTMQAVKERAGA